jgi:outer membrane protein assembly factor BamB
VVDGRPLVFYADGRGTCYAFDPKPVPGKDGKPGTLKTVWTYDCTKPAILNANGRPEGFEIIGTPVFHKGRVFVSLGKDPGMSSKENGRLVCIDARGTGDITASGTVWRFDDIKASASTVVIHDNRLYCADMLGNFYCLDATTGKLLWQHTVKGGVIWSSPLVADGKVYLGYRGKGLIIFADAPEKRIIHEGGKFFLHTSPAVANGIIYIAAHHAVFALKPTASTP